MSNNLIRQIAIFISRHIFRNMKRVDFSVIFIIKLFWHLFNFYCIFLVTSHIDEISELTKVKLSIENIILLLFYWYFISLIFQLFTMQVETTFPIFLRKLPVSKNEITLLNILITIFNYPLLYSLLFVVFLTLNTHDLIGHYLIYWSTINLLFALILQLLCALLKLLPFVWMLVALITVLMLYKAYEQIGWFQLNFLEEFISFFSIESTFILLFSLLILFGVNFLLVKKRISDNI